MKYTDILMQAPDELIEYIAQDMAAAKNMITSTTDNGNEFASLKPSVIAYANYLDAMTKQEFNAPYNTKPYCNKGCHWCCCLQVSTSPMEVFCIADYLLSNKPQQYIAELIIKLAAIKEITCNLTQQEHVLKKISCPLLSAGECSIYSVRPMSCRGYYSYSAEQCEKELCHSSNNVSFNGTAQWRFKAAYIGISMGLEEFGICNDTVELAVGLCRALSQPDMFSEWLSGSKFI